MNDDDDTPVDNPSRIRGNLLGLALIMSACVIIGGAIVATFVALATP